MHPKMGKQLRCAPARSSGGDIMLNIQHFTKTYGEKKAVDDLSLHIAPIVISPASNCRMPTAALSVVVLPAPLWPMKP